MIKILIQDYMKAHPLAMNEIKKLSVEQPYVVYAHRQKYPEESGLPSSFQTR